MLDDMKTKMKMTHLITALSLFALLSIDLAAAPESLHFEVYKITNKSHLNEIAEIRRGTDKQKYDSFLNELASKMEAQDHWDVAISESGRFDWADSDIKIQGELSERQESPEGYPVAIEITEEYVSPVTKEKRERVRLSTSTLLPIDGYSIVLSGMSYSVDKETGKRMPTLFEFQRMGIRNSSYPNAGINSATSLRSSTP